MNELTSDPLMILWRLPKWIWEQVKEILIFIYLLVLPLVVGHNGCYLLDWTLLYDNEEKATKCRDVIFRSSSWLVDSIRVCGTRQRAFGLVRNGLLGHSSLAPSGLVFVWFGPNLETRSKFPRTRYNILFENGFKE